MLKSELDEILQSIYNKAVRSHPEIKDVLILYNTNSTNGVEVSKGTDEDTGIYRISCEGRNDSQDVTVSSFALGLVLVIYDVKYGSHGQSMTSGTSGIDQVKFDTLYHEFFPGSALPETLRFTQ